MTKLGQLRLMLAFGAQMFAGVAKMLQDWRASIPTSHAISVYPMSPVVTQHSLLSGRYSLLGPTSTNRVAPAAVELGKEALPTLSR